MSLTPDERNMDQRPNALVLGGMNSIATSFVHYLIPREGEALVAHLLYVDKFSIFPPTVFVSKEFIGLATNRTDVMEYRQANLQNPDVIKGILENTAPNGRPYEYIFDFTGDLSYDRPSSVQIATTFKISLNIAQEASKHNIKAYIRVVGPFYDQCDGKKIYKEEDLKGWKPWGTRGVWWTETIRALGSIPNLPLVVLRCGVPYGPGLIYMEVTSCLLIGLVYKSMGKEMKFLWSPKLRKNTIHGYDLAAACWKAAGWISVTGRAAGNQIAGTPVPPTNDKEVETIPEAIHKSAGAVVVPVFNVVDDTDTTQESLGQVIAKTLGIKVGFQGRILSTISGLRMNDVVEDVNELHMEQWAKIIMTSSPPVPSTPLSPYAPAYIIDEHGYALDGGKAKRILGLELKYPQFDEFSAREFIDWCRQEGIWPESPQLYMPLSSQ